MEKLSIFFNTILLTGTIQLAGLFSMPHALLAQSRREILYMEIFAREEFKENKYYTAMGLFEELDSIHPGEYHYPLGVCHYFIGNMEKAIAHLDSCLKSPEDYPPQLHYFSAKAYQSVNNFDKAMENFHHYLDYLHARKKKSTAAIQNTEHEIQMCRNAKKYISQPVDIRIVSLGEVINSEFAEYGPVMSADESMLIFTSCRPNTTGGQVQETDGTYYEDIYIAHKDSNGQWLPPVNMGTTINTDGHDASIALTPDGQKFLLYRSGKENMLTVSSGDLYMTELKGQAWTTPAKLGSAINTHEWESSGCISADGKTLYFSSNRDGGEGGSDLYYSKLLTSGAWGNPINMGPSINTPYNEDSPFMHPDGKNLYFSSNGMKSMGGHDIFHSQLVAGQWTEPENLGYPINSSREDTHFSLSADGKRLYFSSLRPEGKGNQDIYYAELNHSETEVLVLTGFVTDKTSNAPLEASLTLVDTKTNEVYGIFNSNSVLGKYTMIMEEGKDYTIAIHSNNYQVMKKEINLTNQHRFKKLDMNFTLHEKNK